jgi:2-polyprenyl-3-methyl-5-hydroxy-6-metoxy-1,4-benzoquinol methylase
MTSEENPLDYFQKNRISYNQMAPAYRTRRERGDFRIYPDMIKFADLIEKTFSNPSILDIGPGAGIMSAYMSKKGFKTYAVDISEEMINIAREESPSTEYFLGNSLDYDFHNTKFDGIFAKAIIHLFAKDDATIFLNKSSNLLNLGGLLYLSLFIRDDSIEGFAEKSMEGKKFSRYTKNWTKGELDVLLRNSELQLIDSWNLPHGTMVKWSGILKK